ncbi:MAG TPA: uL15m family ribosomal protein [Candidatus Paceibacterota bacterium]|nr:uL15m family ribosomal protein [Candidatus Paceibacterota bacterium]
MQLHQISKLNRKTARRIGRGGKRGTTSGRGQKGQKSRSGHVIRPASRDLLIRLPKLRGFRNKPKGPKPFLLDLGMLERRLKTLAGKAPVVVTIALLKEHELVPSRYQGVVKVLGDGGISFPLHLKGLKVSAPAKKKIESAGGKVLE